MTLDKTRASRRTILKIGMMAGTAGVVLSASPSFAVDLRGKKMLIVYFSRTGNTREVASQIHEHVGGDLFEVKTVKPYPEAYRATTDQALKEQEANARPDIIGDVADIGSYDTVFIGYPNWWNTMPMALFTFLERHDLSGKTVIPFCTHEGSRLGRSVSDLRTLCPKATLRDGLALRGGDAANMKREAARREVEGWLRRLDLVG